DFRAPRLRRGAEHRVGPGDRARSELLDPAGERQRAELEPAQVGRAEIGDVESDVGLATALDGAAASRGGPAPGAVVPVAELVADVERDLAVLRVLAYLERGRHVQDANPDAVEHLRLEAAHVSDGMEQRMVGRDVPGADSPDQVDAEEEPPDLAHGL